MRRWGNGVHRRKCVVILQRWAGGDGVLARVAKTGSAGCPLHDGEDRNGDGIYAMLAQMGIAGCPLHDGADGKDGLLSMLNRSGTLKAWPRVQKRRAGAQGVLAMLTKTGMAIKTAHRWESLTDIPEPEFRHHIETVKAKKDGDD